MKPALVTVRIRRRTRSVLQALAKITDEDQVEIMERLVRLEGLRWGVDVQAIEERDKGERNL